MEEINSWLVIGGIKLTEWIQALGTFIAIPAAIVGFVKLFRKNRQLQQQIDSLATLAEQAIKQTDIVRKQYLIQKDDHEINRERRSDEKQDIEFAKTIRKEKIKPTIDIQPETLGYFKMINRGERVKLEKIKYLDNNIVHVLGDLTEDMTIDQGSNVSFNLYPKMPGLVLSQCHVEIEFIISDIDDNHYVLPWAGPNSLPKLGKMVEIEY